MRFNMSYPTNNIFNGLLVRMNSRQSGLTLVEIMVALTISLILMAGIIKIFQSSKQSYYIQQGLSRVQENARLFMDIMIKDISSAGYMGCLNSQGNVINTLNDKSSNYDFGNAIFGVDGGGTNPDSITLRRASEATAIPVIAPMGTQQSAISLDPDHINYDSIKQWDIVTVSDCANAAVLMVTNVPDDTGIIQHEAGVAATDGANKDQFNVTDDLQRTFGSPSASTARIYRVGTTTYEVLPSSSGKTTSLYITPGGELVEGVEDLQIEYGITSNPGTTPVIADRYVDASNVADWTGVVSIRMTFVVNSVDVIVNPGVGDGLLRKTFTTTVRLRNRAPA